jgi:4-alpha-glucanotransferase
VSELARLAELAGIEPRFHDHFGVETWVSDETKRALLQAMGFAVASDDDVRNTLHDFEATLASQIVPPAIVVAQGGVPELPPDVRGYEIDLEGGERFGGELWQLPLGYHRLTVRSTERGEAHAMLIVTPPACHLPPAMEHGRLWALAVQLYSLRSDRDWGIGDFTDLATLGRLAGNAGAGAIALNPLHELFPSNPDAVSPYAPSSRLWLNAQYIDVTAAADYRMAACDVAALCASTLLDYRGVAAVKRAAFEQMFETFRDNDLRRNTARAREFRNFVAEGGTALNRLAVYEALTEHWMAKNPHAYGWQEWPPEYRTPESSAVERFERSHARRVNFYRYLQWIADTQLAQAAKASAEYGVTLYRDLAVGVDLNSADAWADQRTILAGVSLGAPPDQLNVLGQNWGLPPLSPHALRDSGYAPFAALLRSNMRHAGILRIDHVMALKRAFWIPRGRPPVEGAYMRYPFDEMLGVLALESVRNECAVVGEDLGTVPEGFRERMQAASALSSRVFYFERNWQENTFLPPSAYPRLAAASIGTHDLPTLLGWWTGDDIDLRIRINLYPGEDISGHALWERRQARFALVDALQQSGAISEEVAHDLRADAERGGSLAVARELAAGAYRFLAQTPSMLAVVSLEDVFGEVDAVNVPGTVDEHPNWQRKQSRTLEELEKENGLMQIGSIFGNVVQR